MSPGFADAALGSNADLSKERKERLDARGIDLQMPLRLKMKGDNLREFGACMRRFRKGIETIFPVLVRKLSIAKIKARIMERYMSKITRKILAYNFPVRLKRV